MSLPQRILAFVLPVPAAVGTPRFAFQLQRAGVIDLVPPPVPILATDDGELGPEAEVTDDSDGTVEFARHDASDIESFSSEEFLPVPAIAVVAPPVLPAVPNGGVPVNMLVRGRDYFVQAAGAEESCQRQLRFLARRRNNIRLLYFLDLPSNQVRTYRADRVKHITPLDFDELEQGMPCRPDSELGSWSLQRRACPKKE